jgi:ankyrin repeat protein
MHQPVFTVDGGSPAVVPTKNKAVDPTTSTVDGTSQTEEKTHREDRLLCCLVDRYVCDTNIAGQQKLGEEVGNELIEVSRAGDCAKVETLLASQDEESFINYQNEDTFTPLHCSTVNNQLSVTKLLIEPHCNLQQYDGSTPLYMLAFFGHPEIPEQMIETRANLDLQHQNGYTPLMITVYRGHASVTTLLLEHAMTLMSRRSTSTLLSLQLSESEDSVVTVLGD